MNDLKKRRLTTKTLKQKLEPPVFFLIPARRLRQKRQEGPNLNLVLSWR
jgi:hypothetical protein